MKKQDIRMIILLIIAIVGHYFWYHAGVNKSNGQECFTFNSEGNVNKVMYSSGDELCIKVEGGERIKYIHYNN